MCLHVSLSLYIYIYRASHCLRARVCMTGSNRPWWPEPVPKHITNEIGNPDPN